MAKSIAPFVKVLLEMVDQAFNKRAWHGANLKDSLKGLTLKQLLWRPGPKRHNIWEVAIHTAYWKYTVYRQLADAPKNSFPRTPSNFPKIPDKPSMKLWKEDLALLDDYHAKFKKAIQKLTARDLDKKIVGKRWTTAQKIIGVASHDLYHTGQIQLLKRLMKK